MRTMSFSILLLVVACGACSSSGTGKSPGTPPGNPPPPTAPHDAPPTVTDADLHCDPNAPCTEVFVWTWREEAKGYCTGCRMIPVNQAGADRLLAWYKPREGRGCPMHDCERPKHEAACVEGRCVHVPVTPGKESTP